MQPYVERHALGVIGISEIARDVAGTEEGGADLGVLEQGAGQVKTVLCGDILPELEMIEIERPEMLALQQSFLGRAAGRDEGHLDRIAPLSQL